MKSLIWITRAVGWIAGVVLLLTLADNFLTAPLGFKEASLPSYHQALYWTCIASFCFAVALAGFDQPKARKDKKSVIPWAEPVEDRQYRRRKEAREQAGQEALKVHALRISESKRLCAIHGFACDNFGLPEPCDWGWFFKMTPEEKDKFERASRVSEAYKPLLLESLRDAIGNELMSKLGKPEPHIYPMSDRPHSRNSVLAFSNVEFKHPDKSLFEGVYLGREEGEAQGDRGFKYTNPEDRNIEVNHVASFGMFDVEYGEQFIPGDLRVIVGVKVVDESTSYYSPRKFQVNPTPETFLKDLVDLDQLPRGSSRYLEATAR